MSANLITGNLFKPIYAYQDADYQAGISGNVTSIMPVGSQMALSIEDANTIKADDGVLITKEGRRIQIDAGAIEEWSIPTGTQGVTNYFIIGFHLYTDSNSAEVCETFVEQMENATDTIPEDTFREGSTEVYVSLGRVVQSGINLDSVTSLVQIAQSFEDVKNAISSLNNGLNSKTNKTTINEYTSTPSNLTQFVQGTATGNLMMNFKFSDTNNVLGLGANWVKGYIQYQNPYGSTWDVSGTGIASLQGGNPIFIKITGTGTSFAVTRRDLTQDTVTDFTVVEATKQFTVSNTNAFVVSFSPTIPSGYTPLGIVAAKSGDTALSIIGFGTNDSGGISYRVDIAPLWSHNGTYTAKIRVLCMRKA